MGFPGTLVLFLQRARGGTGSTQSSAAESVPIQFRDLRLRLGPNLSVDMPPIVSFRGGGQLLLNGPLDPSLKVRGLIHLDTGRISLPSSSFRLDHRARTSRCSPRPGTGSLR